MILAFACEVVHEKLWKSINICKSYSKRISGTFFLDTVYVPKNGVFGGFEGEDVKILSSDPQKALPCVNTRLLMYRVTKSI